MHEAARECRDNNIIIIMLAIADSYVYRLIAGWSVHRARALMMKQSWANKLGHSAMHLTHSNFMLATIMSLHMHGNECVQALAHGACASTNFMDVHKYRMSKNTCVSH